MGVEGALSPFRLLGPEPVLLPAGLSAFFALLSILAFFWAARLAFASEGIF